MREGSDKLSSEVLRMREPTDKSLPSPGSIPNRETVAAMKEAKKSVRLKRYSAFRELRERL